MESISTPMQGLLANKLVKHTSMNSPTAHTNGDNLLMPSTNIITYTTSTATPRTVQHISRLFPVSSTSTKLTLPPKKTNVSSQPLQELKSRSFHMDKVSNYLPANTKTHISV